MVLWVESDETYIRTQARSSAGGYHIMSSKLSGPDSAPKPTDLPPLHNGPSYVYCRIMREVLSSAGEAELGVLFHIGKEACSIRITHAELGHTQPAAPMTTANSTASGIANSIIKQE